MNKADLTRWSWVEIDRGALRRNTRAYKNLLNPRQRLCCVVKADAYGHGAVECAKIMYSAGADMFAVATVNEGVGLRQGGITKPILILSEPPIEAIPALLEFDIMPSVYTSDFALAYGECAVAAGKVGKYHLTRGQRLRFYLDYAGRDRLNAGDKRRVRRIVRFFEGRE